MSKRKVKTQRLLGKALSFKELVHEGMKGNSKKKVSPFLSLSEFLSKRIQEKAAKLVFREARRKAKEEAKKQS